MLIHIHHVVLAVWDSNGAFGASFGPHGFFVASNLRSFEVW